MSSLTCPPTVNPEPLDLVRLRFDLALSRERMARLFDVSAKTIERWESRGSLPRDVAGRHLAVELCELIDLGLLVYNLGGLQRFLALPLPSFEGATPLQLIERGQIDVVLGVLAADYEGLGP